MPRSTQAYGERETYEIWLELGMDAEETAKATGQPAARIRQLAKRHRWAERVIEEHGDLIVPIANYLGLKLKDLADVASDRLHKLLTSSKISDRDLISAIRLAFEYAIPSANRPQMTQLNVYSIDERELVSIRQLSDEELFARAQSASLGIAHQEAETLDAEYTELDPSSQKLAPIGLPRRT